MCLVVCIVASLVNFSVAFAYRFQITEALSFLHYSGHVLHRNVCPASILVTKKGTWKLAGLEFTGMMRMCYNRHFYQHQRESIMYECKLLKSNTRIRLFNHTLIFNVSHTHSWWVFRPFFRSTLNSNWDESFYY